MGVKWRVCDSKVGGTCTCTFCGCGVTRLGHAKNENGDKKGWTGVETFCVCFWNGGDMFDGRNLPDIGGAAR